MPIGLIECTKGRNCIPNKHDDPQKRRDRLSGKTNCGWAVELRTDKFANGPWAVHQVKSETAANAECQGHNHPLSKEDVAHSIQLLALNTEHKKKIEEGVRLGHKISTVMDTLRGTWPDMTFEYRRVFKEFQKAHSHKKQQTLDLSGFSEAADLLKLLGERDKNQPGWYIAYDMDSQRRLTHVFWMSPLQRELYHRYVLEQRYSKGVTTCVQNNGKESENKKKKKETQSEMGRCKAR